ncbi:histidinol-phosphate transaminase [Nibrella saemangeumensis]|uniref:Histidinol-phosphate transaminase n=1 Tax=Nibrella saemangeumensis TaxID=1084526 RepID=A0ABP8MPC5_9BACT
MNHSINRRDWLRNSALLATGLSTGLSQWNPALPAAVRQEQAFVKEFAALGEDLPVLRARLFANENPHGISPKAREALIKAIDVGNRYAFREGSMLREMIAVKEGIKEENLMLCAGSSELLMTAALFFTGRGGKILTSRPTYDDLLECASAFNAEIVSVPQTTEHRYDLNAMKAKLATTDGVKLVYICNPNNPTGTILSPDELTAFCKEVSPKVPVFVDEAYIDFLAPADRPNLAKLVTEGYNIILARTFSKIHGFAGLRLGYGMAPAKLVKEISAYNRGEYEISVTTITAGMASYQDQDWQNFCRTENAKAREVLYKGLKQLGYEYVPSYTNFVLFPIRMKTKAFAEQMFRNGVGTQTRDFDNQPWCRVSIGTVDEMNIFLDAFKKVTS